MSIVCELFVAISMGCSLHRVQALNCGGPKEPNLF